MAGRLKVEAKKPTGKGAAHLRAEGIAFLRALIRANRRDPVEAREWFAAHKETWERELKQPMLAIITAVTEAMEEFAPEHVRPAEKSFFRIYRDTRFSADKRPYKEHVAAWWSHRELEKTSGAGFYFHVAPDGVTVAAGAYMPGKEQLELIRNWLLEHHEEFRGLLEGRAVKKVFEEFEGNALTRAPKGFPVEHPALDLIRCRQWGVATTLPVESALGRGFVSEIVRRFRLAAPVVGALNSAILVAGCEGSELRRKVLFGFAGEAKSAKNR